MAQPVPPSSPDDRTRKSLYNYQMFLLLQQILAIDKIHGTLSSQ